MRKRLSSLFAFSFFLVFTVSAVVAQAPGTQPASGPSQTGIQQPAPSASPAPKVCSACIRAHMEFLASDALRGRGSATPDELVAATYIASQLRLYRIEPAGDDGGYIQRAPVLRRKLTAASQLKFTTATIPAEQTTWTYGQEFLVIYLTQTHFSGPLRKVDADRGEIKVVAGSVLLITGKDRRKVRNTAFALASAGAAGVIVAFSGEPEHFETSAEEPPQLPPHLEGSAGRGLGGDFNVLEASAAAARVLEQLPQDTMLQFDAPSTPEKGYTWNAVGILRGRNPALQHAAVLLSACAGARHTGHSSPRCRRRLSIPWLSVLTVAARGSGWPSLRINRNSASPRSRQPPFTARNVPSLRARLPVRMMPRSASPNSATQACRVSSQIAS